MNNKQSLSKLSRNISRKLLDSIYLLEIMEELTDGKAKEGTLLDIVQNKIHTAFNDIEQCRKILS